MEIEFFQNNEPKIIYSANALKKMIMFTKSNHAQNKEFLFVGLVARIGNDFNIVDFLLPPQIDSTAYCETDDDNYPEWLNANIGIQRRVNLRCFAHSHVNMNTTPSGTDNKMIRDLIDNVSDYYIQLIINNRFDNFVAIYLKEGYILKNVKEYVNFNNVLIRLPNLLGINYDYSEKELAEINALFKAVAKEKTYTYYYNNYRPRPTPVNQKTKERPKPINYQQEDMLLEQTIGDLDGFE